MNVFRTYTCVFFSENAQESRIYAHYSSMVRKRYSWPHLPNTCFYPTAYPPSVFHPLISASPASQQSCTRPAPSHTQPYAGPFALPSIDHVNGLHLQFQFQYQVFTRMWHRSLCLLALLLPFTAAQFNIFDQFFGGQQRQQHQQQQHSGQGQQSLWQAQAEAVPCAAYLCPETLVCVASPAECPCPNVQDVKCLLSDAQTGQHTVVCARGPDGCKTVERLGRQI